MPVAGLAEDKFIEELLITGMHMTKAPGMASFVYYDALIHSPLERVAKFSAKHSFERVIFKTT